MYDILKGTRWSSILIIGLFVIILVLLPFSFVGEDQAANINVEKIAKYNIGKTVFAGDDVIEESNINHYPVVTNIDYLIENFRTLDFQAAIKAISTGVVALPISEFTSGGISDSGIAEGFSGPGVLTEENNKLIVKGPDNFVWGYKVPYTKAFKTNDGLDIVEENVTVRTIGKNDINNNTIDSRYISGDVVAKWYNRKDIGEFITLDYGIAGFSDNRSLIKPDEIKPYFGDEVYEYIQKYPSNTPIMVYKANYDEVVGSDAYSYLGSYPQYNDANRAFNAKQFVTAWNGTIIPPNSSSSGAEIIGFAISKDPKAPGGGASHGVCPPARALRSVASAMGFPLPSGMNWGHEAVNFGVNPGSEIRVTNNGEFPVKLIMWTEGEGTGIVIYAKLIKLVPKGYETNSSNNASST